LYANLCQFGLVGTLLAVFHESMNKNCAFLWCAPVLLLTGALLLCTPLLTAAERNITRTNWTERWITNLIEVRMPTNRFVDEFHTNWIERFVTNVVTIQVEKTRTVRVEDYKTNWNTLRLTNRIPVNMVRTNFVDLVQTNWRNLTLTNWETVLVMKTNWITQPVTNVVQIDLISSRVAPIEVAAKAPPVKESSIEPSISLASTPSESLEFEVSRTSRPANKNVAELLMKARWVASPNEHLQVRQWRVESQDGAILSYSQDQDFMRELPIGKYRIEVKAQRDANSPLLSARGLVDLKAADATVLPLASARR